MTLSDEEQRAFAELTSDLQVGRRAARRRLIQASSLAPVLGCGLAVGSLVGAQWVAIAGMVLVVLGGACFLMLVLRSDASSLRANRRSMT
jgi:hypothetical protein